MIRKGRVGSTPTGGTMGVADHYDVSGVNALQLKYVAPNPPDRKLAAVYSQEGVVSQNYTNVSIVQGIEQLISNQLIVVRIHVGTLINIIL